MGPDAPGAERTAQEIRRRLLERSSRVHQGLGRRLDNIRRDHDLDWRTLLSAHREIAEQARTGSAPSPSDYWAISASPATIPLVTAACMAIDDELEGYQDALKRFLQSTTFAARLADFDPAPYDEAISEARTLLETCVLDRTELDRIGARWQAKLRRRAQRATLPAALFTSTREADSMALIKELELLDEAPWAHDDRLLWAFEVAHSEVRSHLLEQLDKLSVVVPRRAARQRIILV